MRLVGMARSVAIVIVMARPSSGHVHGDPPEPSSSPMTDVCGRREDGWTGCVRVHSKGIPETIDRLACMPYSS